MDEKDGNWKPIVIDLEHSVIDITLQERQIQFSVHFNKDPRRFYLAVIALVVHTMKTKGLIAPIKMKLFHKNGLLIQLNNALFDPKRRGSNDESKLIGRIYRKWRDVLPWLDRGSLFVPEERDRIQDPDFKIKRYECTASECKIWKQLFSYTGKEAEVSLCFSIDNLGLSLDDVSIQYRGDKDAWERFVRDLKATTKEELSSDGKGETAEICFEDKQTTQVAIDNVVHKYIRYIVNIESMEHVHIAINKCEVEEIYRGNLVVVGNEVVDKSKENLIEIDDGGLLHAFNLIHDEGLIISKNVVDLIRKMGKIAIINGPTVENIELKGRTLFRYIAWVIALNFHEIGLIPIIVSAYDYSMQPEVSLLEYALNRAVANSILVGEEKHILLAFMIANKNRLIFLVDGIDMVGDNIRAVKNEILALKHTSKIIYESRDINSLWDFIPFRKRVVVWPAKL